MKMNGKYTLCKFCTYEYEQIDDCIAQGICSSKHCKNMEVGLVDKLKEIEEKNDRRIETIEELESWIKSNEKR